MLHCHYYKIKPTKLTEVLLRVISVKAITIFNSSNLTYKLTCIRDYSKTQHITYNVFYITNRYLIHQ